MEKHCRFLLVLLLGLNLSSCEDFLEPRDNKPVTDEMLNSDPVYMEGLLLHAYSSLPNKYAYNSDAATDNAVSNAVNLSYRLITGGAWSPEYTPYNNYDSYFTEIYYINKFLSLYKNVNWSNDFRRSAEDNKAIAEGHQNRLKGEAYGLRAYYQYQLLQEVSGMAENNELMGFPIVNQVYTVDSNFKLPRNTFYESVSQIIADCDTALKTLPLRYEDIAGNVIHNSTFGARFLDRIDARGVMAIKAQTLLLAASPAFNPTNDLSKWEAAAEAAADLITYINGILPPGGRTFYRLASATQYNTDVIWANTKTNRNDFERENYPPSLNGSGNINPTQNLVDAFPMATGYPVDEDPNYNPLQPYAGRDLRFYEYIITDGQTFISPINTYEGAGIDGLNNLLTSTRTGYYMKKFLDPATRYNPETGAWSRVERSYVHFRYTQMFLNFAEAANEAWGPLGNPRAYPFTAQSILGLIRVRAGIPSNDPYLYSVIGSDQTLFRELVRNERRLELCFEGSRFWDIRRWNLVNKMTETARGMRILEDNGVKTYNVIDVEPRRYQDYMIYPPLPASAVIKSGLFQNKGW